MLEIECSMCGITLEDNPGVNFVPIDEEKDVYICEKCVANIHKKLEILHQQTEAPEDVVITQNKSLDDEELVLPKLPKPEEILNFLNDYVVGQEEAKKILSVAAYNHYKQIAFAKLNENNPDKIELQKSNIVLVGPSGAGKTELIRTLSKCLGVPLAICDASSLSSTGYVGADPVNTLTDLLSRAEGDVEKAQMGIVFIDEFDKLAKKNDDNTHKDVTGEGVQQELLKIIEGNVIDVPSSGNKKIFSDSVKLDTSNILFICGGAFEGIEDIIRERLNKKDNLPDMGFGNTTAKSENKTKEYNSLISDVTTEDLKEFGIIREMLGRLPVICPVKELTEEELIKILTEPKSAIVKQYQAMFSIDNALLVFQKKALTAIAKSAIKRKTGARGLRSIIEHILTDTMYKIPNLTYPVQVTVTEACVTQHKAPKINEIEMKEGMM